MDCPAFQQQKPPDRAALWINWTFCADQRLIVANAVKCAKPPRPERLEHAADRPRGCAIFSWPPCVATARHVLVDRRSGCGGRNGGRSGEPDTRLSAFQSNREDLDVPTTARRRTRAHWRRWRGRCAGKVATISIGWAVRSLFTCMRSSMLEFREIVIGPGNLWRAPTHPRTQR